MHKISVALTIVLAILTAGIAHARCNGADLRGALSAAEVQRMQEIARGIPYPAHRLWQIERDGVISYLFGTIHLDADGIVLPQRLTDAIPSAAHVLVEITRADEKRFEEKLKDPALLFDFTGPGLLPEFSPDEWRALGDALSATGLPRLTHNTLRPWFVGLAVAIAPCAVPAPGKPVGLDPQVEAAARAHGVPVASLDDPDKLLAVLTGGTRAEKLDMIRAQIPMLDQRNDLAATMAKQYLDGEIYQIWALNQVFLERSYPKDTVAGWMRSAWDTLVVVRNRQWIDVIDQTATRPTIIAVGALHLPGQQGLLQLLTERGFTVSPVLDLD